MALTSTKVETFTLHSSCSIRSVWCTGTGRLLVRLDDNITPGIFTMRTPTSITNGVAWSDVEPDDHHNATFLPLGPLAPLPDGSLIAGWGLGHPADPYDTSFAFIGHTADAGVTWDSRIDAAVYATLVPDEVDIFGLTQVSADEWLAYGLITVAGPTRYHFMRSTDGAATFTPFSGIGTPSSISSVTSALAVGGGVVLAAGNFLGGDDIYRSTDGGLSWTGILLPVGADPTALVGVTSFALIGPGVVLVGGQMESGNPVDTNHLEPVLWRSTDSGATWTLIRLADFGLVTFDPGPPTLQRYTVNTFAFCASAAITFLGVGCITAPPFSGQPFWYSTDLGLTWTPGTFAGSPPSNDLFQITQMVIADDGGVITAVNAFTGAGHTMEMWRTVLDGFTGPGNCNGCVGAAAPGAAVMGVAVTCVPILSPAPCPPLCPVDPEQPIGLLVSRTAPGGGWLDPLGVVDLVEELAPGLMGVPTLTCGAMFANNNCAVTGA